MGTTVKIRNTGGGRWTWFVNHYSGWQASGVINGTWDDVDAVVSEQVKVFERDEICRQRALRRIKEGAVR